MNNIQDLIKKLCPNGVEYKKIGDCCESICSGLNPRSNFVLNTPDASFFYLTTKEINKDKIIFNNKTSLINSEALKKIQKRSKLKKGSILLSSIGTIGKVAIVNIETNNWNCSESILVINVYPNILNNAFLAYLLRSRKFQDDAEKYSKGTTLKGIRKEWLLSYEIPIPPLEIQNKIVEILDKFSKYEAELEAELEARKKQYDYYLNLVFDRLKKNGGVLRKKIGDISTFYNGLNSKKAEHFKNGNSKYITYLNVFNNSSINLNELKLVQINKEEKQNKLIKGDVIFTNSSESKNEIGISSVVSNNVNFDLYLNSFCFFIRFNKDIQINPFFSKYLFRSTYVRKQIIKCCNGVTRFNLSKKNMKNIEIIIPPLKIQNKIVEVLDNFENICANLKIGLPKEIELRQKQYEYYRDKLLSFDILDNNIERERERERRENLIKLFMYIFEGTNFSIELPLWCLTNWNKKFNSVEKCKQEKIIKIRSISAKQLKEMDIENGDIKLLSTGKFEGYTNNELGNKYINDLEIIALPEGGNANLKYFKGKFINSLNLIACSSDEKLFNLKYIYYCLKSKIELINSHYRGSGVKHPDMNEIMNIKISIPPIDVQNKVVHILDKFNYLIENIGSGLPMEIELRKKQYEYYRELLLNL